MTLGVDAVRLEISEEWRRVAVGASGLGEHVASGLSRLGQPWESDETKPTFLRSDPFDKAPNDNTPSTLESEIVKYLRRHPNAADTLEGISEWWLLETRIDKVKKDLEAALRNLVAKELVRVIRGADGRVTYRVGVKKQNSRAEKP